MTTQAKEVKLPEVDYSKIELPVFSKPILPMERHADDIMRVRKNLYNLGLIDDVELVSHRKEQDYAWEFLKICFLGMLPVTTYE